MILEKGEPDQRLRVPICLPYRAKDYFRFGADGKMSLLLSAPAACEQQVSPRAIGVAHIPTCTAYTSYSRLAGQEDLLRGASEQRPCQAFAGPTWAMSHLFFWRCTLKGDLAVRAA